MPPLRGFPDVVLSSNPYFYVFSPTYRSWSLSAMQTRALIMVAGANGNTMEIARALGKRLRRHGHRVDVADAMTTAEPALTDYEAVIFGAQAGQVRERRALGEFIARHRVNLADKPTGLFILAGSRQRDTYRQVETFASSISWRPNFAAMLAVKRRALLRTAARRLIGGALAMISGSRDVASEDEMTALADAIGREMSRSRARA